MHPLLFILLISFPSVSAMLFTPSLPLFSADFAVPESMAQWSMAIFLIGYMLGLLPLSLITNRWGSKQAIYTGLVLAFLGTLICVCSYHFSLFNCGRFIQAFGASVGLKLPFTMITDRSKGSHEAQKLFYVMVASAAMGGLAIAIGGFLTVDYGWRGCFIFLLFYTLLLCFLCRDLPEKTVPLHGLHIARELGRQWRDLLLHGFLMGCGTAFIYVFATTAPYLAIEQMGMDPRIYGLWNILPSVGAGIGLFIATQLLYITATRVAILSGILLSLIGVIALNLALASHIFSGVSLFLPMLFIQGGSGISYRATADLSNTSTVFSLINISTALLAMLLLSVVMPIAPIGFGGLFAVIIGCQFLAWFFLKT